MDSQSELVVTLEIAIVMRCKTLFFCLLRDVHLRFGHWIRYVTGNHGQRWKILSVQWLGLARYYCTCFSCGIMILHCSIRDCERFCILVALCALVIIALITLTVRTWPAVTSVDLTRPVADATKSLASFPRRNSMILWRIWWCCSLSMPTQHGQIIFICTEWLIWVTDPAWNDVCLWLIRCVLRCKRYCLGELLNIICCVDPRFHYHMPRPI